MESLHLISLTTFLFYLLLITTTTTAAATATDFIRTSCNDTSYPSICYTTLSPHAPFINNSNALLASTSISISLKKSKSTAAYVTRLIKTLSPETTSNNGLAMVLDDCVSTLTDAAELARDSMKQMSECFNGGCKDQSLVFKIGNVKTWMSAALSNQVTCVDGFEEVDDGFVVKSDVVKRVEVVKMVTSNALALVNKFVNA